MYYSGEKPLREIPVWQRLLMAGYFVFYCCVCIRELAVGDADVW